jgi:hypothetical protein
MVVRIDTPSRPALDQNIAIQAFFLEIGDLMAKKRLSLEKRPPTLA